MVLLQGARGGQNNTERSRGRGDRVVQARGGISKGGGRGGNQTASRGGRRGGRGGRDGGRGGRGPAGRGRGRGRDNGKSKPKTKEELDRELDSYILRDTKTAQHKLNNDLDDYFAAKKDKKAETTEAAAEAPKEATT